VERIAHLLTALSLAPLLPGIINRVKARLGGRRGPPLLQLYYDLARLARKGAVYSVTTTWVFRVAPPLGAAALVAALLLMPLGGARALVAFPGDFLLIAGLFAMVRFSAALAALDTGSSFEGMGASREVQFGALAEPALLLAFAGLVLQTGEMSLSEAFPAWSFHAGWRTAAPVGTLLLAAWGIVLLTETSRVPVDDPDTHLELTMIHEVMALDHSGPDWGLIQYAAALKFWLLGALPVNLALAAWPPETAGRGARAVLFLLGQALLAVIVGLTESAQARLRLTRVPQFILAGAACALLAAVMALKG